MVTADDTVYCQNCESQPAMLDRLPGKQSDFEVLRFCWSCAQDFYGATPGEVARAVMRARGWANGKEESGE